MEKGKQNSRTFPGLFFIFHKLTVSSQFKMYKTMGKCTFSSRKHQSEKELIFSNSDSSDENQDYCKN